jgi:hypothetical protein
MHKLGKIILKFPTIKNNFSIILFLTLLNISTASALEQPNLFDLPDQLAGNRIKLMWSKVNTDALTITYIISYYQNDDTVNKISFSIGDPSTTETIETLSYTLNNLDRGNYYHIRLQARTADEISPWSRIYTCFLNTHPLFDISHMQPADNAKDVSKRPEISWLAIDDDNDELEYCLQMGESKQEMITVGGFTPLTGYQFSEQLKPDTVYFWQILVRKINHDIDFYDGTYPHSDILAFKTVKSGHDLAITDVILINDIKPNTRANFQITVRNFGNEFASVHKIFSMITNNNETHFPNGVTQTNGIIAPNQFQTVSLSLEFDNETFIHLMNPQQITFYLDASDNQDLDTLNNSYLFSFDFEDTQAPEIISFEMSARGNWPDNWWVITGEPLDISISAEDNLKISEIKIEYRLSQTNDWQKITQQFPGQQHLDDTFRWHVPDDISPTQQAEIRLVLFDDYQNITKFQSDPFPVYSNQIHATITTEKTIYSVLEPINYTLTTHMDNPVKSHTINLIYGINTICIRQGDDIQPKSWIIPNNQYISRQCHLELILYDIYGNKYTTQSPLFEIHAHKDIPAPFIMVELYPDEHIFPNNATQKQESKSIVYIRLDSENIIHAVVQHGYAYDFNGNCHWANDYQYISYDPSTNNRLLTLNICDENCQIIDFELFTNTPHVLFKNHKEQYYWKYLQDTAFSQDIVLLNQMVPSISDCEQISSCNMFPQLSSDGYIYAMGYNQDQKATYYLWELTVNQSTMKRVRYYNGICEQSQTIDVHNEIKKDLHCKWIKPVSYLYMIYFIDPELSTLIQFNTQPNKLQLNGYRLPFYIGNNEQIAKKTAIAALSESELFIFGNGNVYQLENNQIVSQNDIEYHLNNEIVSYARHWNDLIKHVSCFVADNIIYVFLEILDNTYPKPESSWQELLVFDPDTHTFSKNVVDMSCNIFPSNGTCLNHANKIILSQETVAPMMNCHCRSIHYIFDPNTGACHPVGCSDIHHPMFIYDPGLSKLYALSTQTRDSFRLILTNLDQPVRQISDAQLFTHDNRLYMSWTDNVFNGTWNYEHQMIQHQVTAKKMIMPLFPQKKDPFEATDFWNHIMPTREMLSENVGKETLTVALNTSSDTFVISQINREYGYTNKRQINKDFGDHATFDMNKNRFIAIGWHTFCAYADYSKVFLDLDINRDRDIGLKDFILTLQVCAGIKNIHFFSKSAQTQKKF